MTPLALLSDLHHTAQQHRYTRAIQPILAACDTCDFSGAVAAVEAALKHEAVQRTTYLRGALATWLVRARGEVRMVA